jgi:hydrogenase nickel incorporation protein HypA/HybF
MHDIAAAQAILRTVLDEASRRGAVRVRRVAVSIGTWDGLRPESLREAFSLEAVGTPAEGAQLDVTVRATRTRCGACLADVPPPVPGAHEGPRHCLECGGDVLVEGDAGFVVTQATMVTGQR